MLVLNSGGSASHTSTHVHYQACCSILRVVWENDRDVADCHESPCCFGMVRQRHVSPGVRVGRRRTMSTSSCWLGIYWSNQRRLCSMLGVVKQLSPASCELADHTFPSQACAHLQTQKIARWNCENAYIECICWLMSV